MSHDVTICALLYGDHPDLADRCLRSIVDTVGESAALRIGLNAVSPPVAAWVKAWARPDEIWESAENICKYPMMRRLFYERPITTR